MKTLKNILRWWLSLASVMGFLSGWAMLAHAPKPVPAEQMPALPTPLAPLPPLGSASDAGSQPQSFTISSSQSQMPVFVTSGS
jgi:energy-converting hydrogenase Eha subunit F